MANYIKISPVQIIDADRITSAKLHPLDPKFPNDKAGVTLRIDGMEYQLHGDDALKLWDWLAEQVK
jgi:hypothetical protein